jgi:hypothetical protein
MFDSITIHRPACRSMADEKLVMHEQRQKNNDRQWHTQKPQ